MNTGAIDVNALVDEYLVPWGIKFVTALIIFIVGRWIVRALVRGLRKLLQRSHVDDMLVRFLGNVAYAALLAVVVLASLEQLGIDTTSALAVLGAAGLAVGLALKDSLSNFAAGVLLIVFRPFKTGDFVEAGGTSGVVEEIRVFNTVFRTGDNRVITVPNSQIYGGTITNVSERETRRVDLVFGIGYDDDIRKAKGLIDEILAADERILKDPEPAFMVLELGASSVDLAVRPWVTSEDYWAVRSDLLEKVKAAFDANGVTIPYPQRDVHLYQSAIS